MQEFKTKLTVDIHDVDANGVARASALMKYIQSAAETQLTEHGMSFDELRGRKRAFILSKITIEFNETIRAYEPLTATTFPCNSRGYTFLRCYKLEKDGRVVGRAVAAWALIDTESRALVKVNDFDLGLETYDPLDIPATRIIIPSDIKPVGTYRVTYSDTDQNNHMNNTRYPDMYSDFLPLSGKRIERITISYMNEAPTKENLTVERAEANGSYYFRTIREDGKVNSEAEIRLTDI
jgi:acyl-ACP thioesterase